MTYFIETEKEDASQWNVILVRSIVKTQRKNIGTKEEYTDNDPLLANFFLSPSELKTNKDDGMVDEATAKDTLLCLNDHNKFPLVIMNQEEDLREEHDHTAHCHLGR